MEHKYSLFLLEHQVYTRHDSVGLFGDTLTKQCCIHLGTFNTLGEAKFAQEKQELKSIIIPTY